MACVLTFHPFSITGKAASAKIELKSLSGLIRVGETFSISVNLSSSVAIGDFEANIKYDKSIMEFVSGGSNMSNNNGVVTIMDYNMDGDTYAQKYVIKFKAKKEGNCSISVKGTPLIYDGDGNSMSVSSNPVVVDISSENEKSSNNELKSLSIKDTTITPSFSSSVTEYEAVISSDITEVDITAEAKDSSAKVSIEGNKDLQVGRNKVAVRVTAEDGDEELYVITVTREIPSETMEPSMEPTVEPSMDPTESSSDVVVDNFQVNTEDGKIILSNSYKFEVVDVDDSDMIPTGYTKTSVRLDGTRSTAYTLENDLENDFLLVYGKFNNEEANFYCFDRQEKTLQRYTGSLSENVSNTVMTQDEYNNKVQMYTIIVGCLAGVIVLLLIIVIRLFMKNRGMKDDLDI